MLAVREPRPNTLYKWSNCREGLGVRGELVENGMEDRIHADVLLDSPLLYHCIDTGFTVLTTDENKIGGWSYRSVWPAHMHLAKMLHF